MIAHLSRVGVGFQDFVSMESKEVFSGVAWEAVTFQYCGNPQIIIFVLHLWTDTGTSGFC